MVSGREILMDVILLVGVVAGLFASSRVGTLQGTVGLGLGVVLVFVGSFFSDGIQEFITGLGLGIAAAPLAGIVGGL
jgi:hypothetical protein